MESCLSNLIIIIILTSLKAISGQEISLESALKSSSHPLVAIHFTAYNNLEEGSKSWAKCEYCVNCPDLEANDPLPHPFYPCPPELAPITEKFKSNAEHIQGIEERFISEFIGFSIKNMVKVIRRSCNFKDDEGDGSSGLGQALPKEGDVTKGKIILDKIFYQDEIESVPEPQVNEEQSWVSLCKDQELPHIVHIIQGNSSSKSLSGWSLTETISFFSTKPQLDRQTLLIYMLQFNELTSQGCACIHSKLLTFKGNSTQLIQSCRKELKTGNLDLQKAVPLSTCLTPQEIENLKIRSSIISLSSSRVEL